MAITTSSPIRANEPVIKASENVLEVRDLTVRYNGTYALDQVSFDVPAGDYIAIIGANGAGKSTLMKAIMGLLQPQAGSIMVRQHGRNANPAQRLGYLPQHDDVNWDFPVTVRDVVMMGRVRQVGWLRRPDRQQWQAIDAALERVGMTALADQQIGELSGGQRRRSFIARALAQEADILLLDEPFSGVDVHAQAELMNVLDELHREGITILLSTHDLGLAFERFKTVMALNKRLIAYGDAKSIYTPDTLAQLYGGRLATLVDGRLVTVFVDEHGCAEC